MFPAIDCGSLINPINGGVALSGSTFMSRATYICNHGYQLTGPVERTCDATGVWTQFSPSCGCECMQLCLTY